MTRFKKQNLKRKLKMIQDFEGQKTTAKKLAQDILISKISEVVDFYDEYLEGLGLLEPMTEKEKTAVRNQIVKVSNRLRLACGYDPRYEDVLKKPSIEKQ